MPVRIAEPVLGERLLEASLEAPGDAHDPIDDPLDGQIEIWDLLEELRFEEVIDVVSLFDFGHVRNSLSKVS